ncbi:FAD-binding domain-containing protein [Leptospira sp.]|uniref:FAD-binding domain-containing protein n=1 Tax=Leptospira sp. TaxID=178 RepID=UPI0025C006E8|nr:FAD-binding domain-containing protein [Leptospira sp.]
MKVSFPTDPISIQKRIQSIDPIKYGSSRNYIDGAVSLLSPYIARGYISTKQIFEHVSCLGHKPYQITKFVQELTWRDYFQQVWRNKGELLFQDLKQPQPGTRHYKIPKSILNGHVQTGIPGINRELLDFYETGYLHNHVRMYIASLVCNIGGAYWKKPSEWMYYHLLDADAASNTCSWQWVSGSFSSKKYIANQENINKYLKTNDHFTYLDRSYEEIPKFNFCPEELEELFDWDLTNVYRETEKWIESKISNQNPEDRIYSHSYPNFPLDLDPSLPVLLYDFYNLDPNWKKNIRANRIFMLRPHFFRKFPSSPKTMDFIFALSKNIPKIKFFWGEWEDLLHQLNSARPEIYWKEHPTNIEYIGNEEGRNWIFPEVSGYYPSFFTYWKKCEKIWDRKNLSNQPSLF